YIPIDTQVAIVEAAESNTFLHLVLPKLISKVVNNENPASASVDMKCIIVMAKNPKRVNIIMRKVLNEDIENVLYTERYLWDDFHSCCCRDEENFQLDRNMLIDGLKRLFLRDIRLCSDQKLKLRHLNLFMESNVASCKDLLLNYIPKMSYAFQGSYDHLHISELFKDHLKRCNRENCPIKEYSDDIFKYFNDHLAH
ncbi:hypothetical protein ROZALSC1DRAFT_25939, partial [Rozella allomycis CSF55]